MPVFGALAASISGSVAESRSGRPLARARVTLIPKKVTAETGRLSQWTTATGQFLFPDLPAGTYLLEANKQGYAAAQYGQRGFGEPSTPISVQAGSHFTADLRLQRLGVVTGAVLDENGVGLPGIWVHAVQATRRLRFIEAARTDDRGVYRLAGLKPGEYYVRTAPAQVEGDAGLAPTYYGQTASARRATKLSVKLDEEIGGADISPEPGRLASVQGYVVGGMASRVTLVSENAVRTSKVGPDGRFGFGQIEPDTYQLLVEPADAAGQMAAYQEVAVGREDVETALELKQTPVLAIRCREAGGQAAETGAIAVFLRRKEFGDASIRIDCGEAKPWSPGNWQIAAAPPPNYYVAEMLDAAQGEDIQEFRLGAAERREITVVLGTDPASVRGQVLTDGGEPVIRAPVHLTAHDPLLRNRIGGVKTTETNGRGAYSFHGLPPGQYEILATFQLRERAEDGWPPGRGRSITVEGGEEAELRLPLTVVE